MPQQLKHAILPQTTHDELARQEFSATLRAHVGQKISPKIHQVYTQEIEPKFKQEHQHLPENRFEIKEAMQDNLHYAWWSALRRTSQEILWESVDSSIQRQIDQLIAKYQQKCQNPNAKTLGTLTLNPDFVIPKYQTQVDIHCMPGGYHTDLRADDITAGALYDRGVYLYTQGRLGKLNDGLGQSIVHNYLKVNYSEWQPRRILDLGCTVGHSTIPYVDAYPNAEVYAIDIGAALLRYGHTRAEVLGKRVHFSQQNAECTNFPDGYFDLIVSHFFLHEIPVFALNNVFKECYRLLATGGVMAHLDAPLYRDMTVYQSFISDWDTANNNEPFWSAMRDLDLTKTALAAGFTANQITPTFIPTFIENSPLPQTTNQNHVRYFGSRGTWYVLAAQK